MSLQSVTTNIVRTYATDGKAVAKRARLIADAVASGLTEQEIAESVTVARVVADFPQLAGHVPTGWDEEYQALLSEPVYRLTKSTVGNLGRAHRLPSEIGGVTTDTTVAMAYKVITRSGTANALNTLKAQGLGDDATEADTLTALTGVLKGWRTAAAEAKPVRDTAADDTPRDDSVADDLTPLESANVPESVEVTVRQLQAIGERGWSLADITALYAAIDELIPALEAQAATLARVTA